jgi:VWFA-related protein
MASTAVAQQPALQAPEPFRTETEAVEIDVRVVDENGRPVRGLTADDFEVYQDGVRQTLRIATPVSVPALPRPKTGITLERDSQSNRIPFDGRVYAIVIDDLHIHPLRANRARLVLRQFVDRYFAANDRAAVVVTSGVGNAMQELTGSASAVLRAVDAFQGRGLTSAVIERINAYYRLRNVGELNDGSEDESNSSSSSRDRQINDPLEFERVYHARQTLTSLRDVARWLGTVPARRKALLFVSEGIEYDLRNLVENRFAGGLLADLQDAIAGAARTSTSIYAIDPRGLGGMEDEKIELSSLPDDTTQLGQSAFANALRLTQENLQVLSEQTGGFALVNTNDLNGGLERLVRDNSEYYVLGYESTNPRRDGRFHRVDVRVTRPGIRVITRRGYYARKENASAPVGSSAPLKALLESPLAVPGLPIDSHVAVLRGAADKGSALVTIEVGPGVEFRQENDIHKGRLEVAVVAIDKNGKVAAAADPALDLNLRPQTRARADEHGIRLTTRLSLKPGRYQIRVAVHDRTSGKGGSVLHDVDVPDYAKSPLMLSQLLVGSITGILKATANVDEELRNVIPLPPTATRAFTPTDEVTVFAELYDNRKTPDPVMLLTTISDEAGHVAFRAEERLDAEVFDPVRRVYRHRVQIPLRGLAPGVYQLQVKAQPTRGATPAVVQQIPLEVHAGVNATN